MIFNKRAVIEGVLLSIICLSSILFEATLTEPVYGYKREWFVDLYDCVGRDQLDGDLFTWP